MWAWHTVALFDGLQDLFAAHVRVRYPPVGDYLIQKDAKGPHVGLDGEAVVEGGLGGSPLDGKLMDNSKSINTSSPLNAELDG